jgi:hypothetical protein
MAAEFPVQLVLEFACSAYRTNNGYLKSSESVFDAEERFLFLKHDNKSLIRYALGIDKYSNTEQEFRPMQLFIEDTDKELADEIRSFYKRLMFAAVKGDNDFQTEIFSLLMTETMSSNKIGWIASLPSVYEKDSNKNRIDKFLKKADSAVLADIGEVVLDKDCEVLRVSASKNFDADNILAIIDNKIVSWMTSKKDVKTGPAVIVKAKVKQHTENWQCGKIETRLNYVKVAQ